MGLTATLLLVVGCTGGLADCRELPGNTPFFETVLECEAERAATISRHSTPQESIFGACVEFDTGLIGADAEIVWQLSEDGQLLVAVLPVEDEGPLLAAHLPQDEMAGRVIRK